MENHILRFSKNTLGRDFIVGDIHGCYYALSRLLDHVNFRYASDRLFSVGDLVDRGPQSIEVLELIKRPWFHSCLGNHEEMLIDHLRFPNSVPPHDEKWLKKIFRSYSDRQVFAGSYLNRLENLPRIILVGGEDDPQRFFVVHAEILESRGTVTEKMILNDHFSNSEKTHKRMSWGRALYQAYLQKKPVMRAHDPHLPLVFCGHTIVETPLQIARQVYIDGGAYTAYEDNKNACLRLYDVSGEKMFSCSPRSGEVKEEKIHKPSTF